MKKREWTDAQVMQTAEVLEVRAWGQVFCVRMLQEVPLGDRATIAWEQMGVVMAKWLRSRYEAAPKETSE